MAAFDPNGTTVKLSTIADFANGPIDGDLMQVPGIGGTNKDLLTEKTDEDSGCRTTWQLIGKYLSLREQDLRATDIKNAFYFYLKWKKVNAGRNTIVLAISQKVENMMPGFHAKDLESVSE